MGHRPGRARLPRCDAIGDEGDDGLTRWGTVSTVLAQPRDVARFIAWHLSLGAADMQVFLDRPNPALADRLAHPRVTFHHCDDAHWARAPAKARSTHQRRQAHNATRAYRRSQVDWLLHIDVDEFLLGGFTAPPGEIARIRPAELLMGSGWPERGLFKKSRRAAGQSPEVHASLHPAFGEIVPDGMLSYGGGKIALKTGREGIRLGLHHAAQQGEKLRAPVTDQMLIGHAHAPSPEAFAAHRAFRAAKGSYRAQGKPNALGAALDVLEAEGRLPDFLTEVASATPARLDLYRAHDMLVDVDMDLDTKVTEIFGEAPL
ncbi:MAG: glycosyltransferase family 2 protein [Pseudomonadota bacterium]